MRWAEALLNQHKERYYYLTPKVFDEDSTVFPVGIVLMSALAVTVSNEGCIFVSSSFALICKTISGQFKKLITFEYLLPLMLVQTLKPSYAKLLASLFWPLPLGKLSPSSPAQGWRMFLDLYFPLAEYLFLIQNCYSLVWWVILMLDSDQFENFHYPL